MKLSTVAGIVLAIYLVNRWRIARKDQQPLEVMPNDPYAGVTDIWETLNGKHLTESGRSPVHQPSLIDLVTTGRRVHCPGHVGIL